MQSMPESFLHPRVGLNCVDKNESRLQKERSCTIAAIQHHGPTWVLPHPELTSPEIVAIVSDEEIERIARQEARAYGKLRDRTFLMLVCTLSPNG